MIRLYASEDVGSRRALSLWWTSVPVESTTMNPVSSTGSTEGEGSDWFGVPKMNLNFEMRVLFPCLNEARKRKHDQPGNCQNPRLLRHDG